MIPNPAIQRWPGSLFLRIDVCCATSVDLNCCFPSDNPAEIPALRLRMAADYIDQPVIPWGGQGKFWRASRSADFRGTWHFYIDDAKFAALRKHPDAVLKTGAPTLVEPNFSLGDSTPLWLGLEIIGRKRWISRFWQSEGRRILVDLHVPEKYRQLNLFGVPRGWKAYATRAHERKIADLEAEHMLAMNHAEATEPADLVFLVYGGNARVRDWCRRRHAEWLPTQSQNLQNISE